MDIRPTLSLSLAHEAESIRFDTPQSLLTDAVIARRNQLADRWAWLLIARRPVQPLDAAQLGARAAIRRALRQYDDLARRLQDIAPDGADGADDAINDYGDVRGALFGLASCLTGAGDDVLASAQA